MIRNLTPSDRDVYLRMAHDFYHSPAVLKPVPDAYLERSFEEMMRSDVYMRGLIFEVDGNVAGYAVISKTYSQEAGGKVAWIEEIYVPDRYRGRGLAHEFFADLHALEPAARYRLETEPGNLRAKRLYESLGFTQLGYEQLVMDVLS